MSMSTGAALTTLSSTMKTILLMTCLVLLRHQASCLEGQKLVNYFAQNINVQYAVINNLQHPAIYTGKISLTNNGVTPLTVGPWALYFCHIRLIEPTTIRPNGTALGTSGLWAEHISGCLHRLTPTDLFRELSPSKRLDAYFNASDWMVARTDSMPNWYVTVPGAQPVAVTSTAGESLDYVEPFSRPEQRLRTVEDQFRAFTPEQRYARQRAGPAGAAPAPGLVPTPVEVKLDPTQLVIVDKKWVIVAEQPVIREANLLSAAIGLPVKGPKEAPVALYIVITLDDVIVDGETNTDDEAYRVNVDAELQTIKITANNPIGAYHGVQTLRSLLAEKGGVPGGYVADYPRFPYRGMLVDVARNFRPKADILQLLDAMSQYKLNKFHFHLSDDEGWRLEIPLLPELTLVGGRRCHEEGGEALCLPPQLGSGPTAEYPGSGFYTAADYAEILAHAAQRHIEVIPSFDMPGHARAAVAAMRARHRRLAATDAAAARQFLLSDPDDRSEYISVQLFTDNGINPCIESTYAFVEHLLSSVKAMHADVQPLKTFHFGGDELPSGAWVKSPACLALQGGPYTSGQLMQRFVQRVAGIAQSEGLSLAGWEDGLLDTTGVPYNRTLLPPPEVAAYVWMNVWEWGGASNAYKLANHGYKVVLCHATCLYFDHPYEPDPEERGYYWAARFTDTRKVFAYLPQSVYDNIDSTRMGAPLRRETFCTKPDACVPLLSDHADNVVGIQGQLWSETVRTKRQFHEMIFPRLLALAERAWHKAAWEDVREATDREKGLQADWVRFRTVVGLKELPRLDAAGIKYRVPPPGARVDNGSLSVNVPYPGLTVEYSVDDMYSWSEYTGHVTLAAEDKVHLRTRSSNKRFSRPIVIQAEKEHEHVETSDVTTVHDVKASSVTIAAVIIQLLLTGLAYR